MSEIYCNTENLQILLNRVNNRYGNIMLPIANFDIGERSKALNAFVNAYKSIYNITVDYCNLVRQDLGAICNIINRFIETDSGLGQDISNSSYVANKVSVETSLNEHDCWKETIMEWNVPSFRVSFDDIDALMREFDNRFTGLRDNVNEYLGQVNLLAQTQSYQGEAAESVRIYLTEVNMNLAEAIALLGEELKELLAKYWLYYKDSVGEINSYVFDEDSMTEVKGYLENKYNELIGEAYDCDSIIRNSRYISVIQSLTLADSGDLFEKFLSLSTTLDSLIEGVREGDNQWEKVINAFISEQCELVAGQISTFRNRARSSVGEYVPGTCDSIEGFDTFMNWLDYISEQVGRNRENIDALYNCEANIADLAEEMQANREELINTIDGVVELSEALIMITLTVATMGNILPASGAVWGTVKNVFDTMFLLRQISNGLEGIDMLTTGKSSDEAVNLLTDIILNGNENAVLVYDLITATLGLIYVVGPQAQTLLNDLKVTNLAQAMGVPYDGANNFLEYLNILEANNILTAEEVELLNTTIINNVINGEVDVVGVLNDLMQSEICSENLLNSAALLIDTNLLQATGYYVGGATEMTPILIDDPVIIGGSEITSAVPTINIGDITSNIIIDNEIAVSIDTGNVLIDEPISVIINAGKAIGAVGATGGTGGHLPPLTIGEIETIGNVSGGTSASSDVVKDPVLRTQEIVVKFNYNTKYDEAEFARQLADQEKALNELTVSEYLKNRERYIAEGRAIEGNAAQQVARENAYLDKVTELRNGGLSFEQAEIEAQKWLETQAALHNPDQIAGGNPQNVGGVGDKNINSSIGSQWKYRIDSVDEQIRLIAATMTEEEMNSTYLNVKLIY